MYFWVPICFVSALCLQDHSHLFEECQRPGEHHQKSQLLWVLLSFSEDPDIFQRCCPMTSKCSAVSPDQIHGAFGWTKYWATWFRYCIVHSCCYYCCGCTSIYSKCDVNSFYLAVDINPSITWQISPYQMSVCFFGRSTNTIQKTWMICTRLYAVVIWDLSVAIQIGLP